MATQVGLGRRSKISAFRSVLWCAIVALTSVAFAPQAQAESGEAVPASRTAAGRISAGRSFTCVVIDGSVYCWGENLNGQLGNGSTTNSSTMVKVSGVTTAVSVAAGDTHACAVLASGSVTCWGSNTSGELGAAGGSAPVIVGGLTDATSVAAGKNYSCAISTSQGVVCWGLNTGGQLGRGVLTPTSDSTPATVTGLTAGVASAIAAGISHACAVLTTGGGVKCWGTAESDTPGTSLYDQSTQDIAYGVSGTALGGLGDGSQGFGSVVVTSPTPLSVKTASVTALSGAVSISVGVGSACAVLETSGVFCWGNNADGRVGNNRITNNRGNYASPRPLYAETVQDSASGAFTGAVMVSINGKHACAITSTASVTCWGSRSYGEVGDGLVGVSAKPSVTDVVGVSNAVAVVSGIEHSCALTSANSVYCWGRGALSQLGNGSTTASTGTPVAVIGAGVQTISFGSLGAKSLSDTAFSLVATSSAGAAVTFTSSTSTVCTVSGSTVTLVGAGTCTIVAAAAAVGIYAAATSVSQSFSVTGLAPTATTSSATSLAATNAVLNATVNPNGADTTVSFVLGKTSDLSGATTTVASKVLTGVGATEVSQKANDLTEADTYYYRVVATNVHGTALGDIKSFTTGRPVGVSINDADEFTNKKNVIVYVTGLPTSVKAIISNDGGFKKSETFDLDGGSAEIKWTLVSSRDERLPKQVYVRFISRFNVQSSNYQDDIILDTTAPVLSDATAASSAAPASAVTVQAIRAAKKSGAKILVKATDKNSGVGTIEVRSSAKKRATTIVYAKPKAASQWVTVKTTAKTLQVRVLDRAGNTSPWKTVRVK